MGNRNRKKLCLTEQDIVAMLRVPEGTGISWVAASTDPPRFWVGLHRDDWPEVPPDAEAPIVEKYAQVIDDRLLVWFPELVCDGEPAVPQLVTEYQWRPSPDDNWVTFDRKSDLVQWLSSHGGEGRMRLVSDWDAFPGSEGEG